MCRFVSPCAWSILWAFRDATLTSSGCTWWTFALGQIRRHWCPHCRTGLSFYWARSFLALSSFWYLTALWTAGSASWASVSSQTWSGSQCSFDTSSASCSPGSQSPTYAYDASMTFASCFFWAFTRMRWAIWAAWGGSLRRLMLIFWFWRTRLTFVF